MDFGHALYPEGDMDDSTDSGVLRKFLSTKNHVNDFAVNQHDGLYWFLYKNLRSNYIWNRNGDVTLKPQICPGFWVTMFNWLFLAVLSPLLMLFVTLPMFAGQLGMNFYTFVGMILGMVTPLLAVIATIFYVCRDTEFINILSNGIDYVFNTYSRFWTTLAHLCFYSVLTIMLGLMTFVCFTAESVPILYGFILLGWMIVYTCAVIMERKAFFKPNKTQDSVIALMILGSVVLLLLPHYAFFWMIISGVAVGIGWILETFTFDLLLLTGACGATWLLVQSMDRLANYETAKTVATTAPVARDYRWFTTMCCIVGCIYVGITIWALSNVVWSDFDILTLLSSIVVLFSVGIMIWLVLSDAADFRKVTPDLLAKRGAYMVKLREKYSPYALSCRRFEQDLRDNSWVVTQDDPIIIADQVSSYVAGFTYHMDSSKTTIFENRAVYIVDGHTAKQFEKYDRKVLDQALSHLGREYFMLYATHALHGYTPEQALQKTQKQKKYDESRSDFWSDSFPVRFISKIVDAIDWFLTGIVKIFTDLFAMWKLMHKYCPAVADKKQI